jgi:hypothetical protein
MIADIEDRTRPNPPSDFAAMQIEVTLTHPAAAPAAMIALEDMSECAPYADGVLVRLPVEERSGAVMEVARRLFRAGIGADDIIVH